MKKFILAMSVFYFAVGPTLQTDALSLVPGGENIAFELYPDGIIVTGSYDIPYKDQTYNPTRDSDIIKGDRIIKIGEKKVTDLSSFTKEFYRYKVDEICPITLIRNNVEENRALRLVLKDNVYKTGLYVKERILGIGTISYYDPESKSYGALAHEVYDQDTESILDVRVGKAYLEDVESIVKSHDGQVGKKTCEVTFDHYLGTIESNTKFGLYGSIEQIPSSYEAIEVAEPNEIELGSAKIRTCITGSKVETFDIEITELEKQDHVDIKGISFKITDPTLLKIGGGIYAGMSGSPIIQNDKLIGAVTHVNVNHVQTGYAVYMKYMYQSAKLNA